VYGFLEAEETSRSLAEGGFSARGSREHLIPVPDGIAMAQYREGPVVEPH
jgi:hypothetical protein